MKKALEIEPDNGSYLDSLGWAYFKADKLDLAEEQPEARRRSAEDQLGHPGSLRRRALQAAAATTTRSRRGTARSPATATRSIAPTSTRRSESARQKLPKDDGAPPA